MQVLEKDNFSYLISNLSTKVHRDQVWKIFDNFGTLKQVHLNKIDVTPAAVIIYNMQPAEQLLTQAIYIDDRRIIVKPIPMSEYVKESSCPVPASKLSLGGLNSPRLFIEEWSTDQYVTFDLNLNEKYIEVFFTHSNGYYRFRVVYDDTLKNTVLLQRYDNITSLTISGKYPAYFWKSKIPMERLTNTYHLDDWERVVEIPLDDFSRDMIKSKATSGKEPISPQGKHPHQLMKLNMWTVYHLEFDIPLHTSGKHLSPENLSHELLERRLNQATAAPQNHSQPSILQRAPDRIFVRPSTKTVDIESHISQFNFEVRYMMEHAFNLKILREYNVDSDFFKKMRQLPTEVSCMFLSQLSAPQERVYNPDSAITHIYRLSKEQIGFQQPIPKDCTTIRRVLVTPTSMYPLQPTIEPMNHLQHHFKDYTDRFLHVRFTDEDLNPVEPIDVDENYPAVEPQNAKLYDRIYTVLRRGLKIAGRTYEFLGCSIKDLRSHGCWFFSPTETMTRSMILNWMGDFREIKSVSRFVNCAGQGFEPRLMTMKIEPNEIEEIEDYVHNGFVFTNDCGKMSPQIARDIAKELGMNYTPSVVRFNLGGASGILLLSNYLTKRKIQLRSSQIRFESPNTWLEIIKVSKPNRVHLNKRAVMLLSSLGVESHVFQELVREDLAYWEKYNNDKQSAYHDLLVNHFSDGRLENFQQILNCKFLGRSDPFISNIVTSYQNYLSRGLKEDCRLYIRDGIKVFAAVDESGTLNPGEIFLQLTAPSGLAVHRRVVEGPCVVYRDSSCFPGDVRVLNAVNYSKLRHYTNVLIFSAIDMQDLPSLCSNDDSAEDNFTVIWDLRLLPMKTTSIPRNYKTAEAPKNLKKMTFKEASKFFTTYISRDTFRLLNRAYMAFSDRHKEGIFNGNCIYLSHQVCRALDFAKTGIFATIDCEFRHYPYPDFMEQNDLRSYTSHKPVGLIYRTTKNTFEKPLLKNHCLYDPRLYVEDMYKYIVDARKTKAKYDHSLRILLGQYAVKSEVEFISGYIIHWPKYLDKNHRSEYCQRIKAAFSRFRRYWKEEFDSNLLQYGSREAQIEAKAAAWYYVTYHPSEYKTDLIYNSTLSRYMSFPWVVDKFISYIANKNATRQPSDEFMKHIPEEKIQNYARIMHNQIIFSDSEDDFEDSDDSDDSEDREEENEIFNENTLEEEQVPDNNLSFNEDHQQRRNPIDRDEDDVPVLNVKLSDLLNL